MSNKDIFYHLFFVLSASFFVILVVFLYLNFTSTFIRPDDTVSYEKEDPVSLEMAFVGDIMMDRGVRNIADKHGGYGYITKYLDFLKDFEIVFGNLEGPVSDKGMDVGGIYSFRMDPLVLDHLSDYNFSVLSVANNHAGDWGLDAFSDTLNRLDAYGISSVGGGFDLKDAKEVSVIKIEDFKVGFLGFTDIGPDWLEADDKNPGILLSRSDYHDVLIEKSAKEVDLLVVSYHFGKEYMKEPSERQRFLATKAIDLGADLVIGHHPHVIQPIEEYNNGVIVYSLGNFIFDQYFSKETMEGLVFTVLVKDGEMSYESKKVDLTDHFQPKLRE